MLWMKKTCSTEERPAKSLEMKATGNWQLPPPKCYLPSAICLLKPMDRKPASQFSFLSHIGKKVLRKCLQTQLERPWGQGPCDLSCPPFCTPILQSCLSSREIYTTCIARVTKKKSTFNLTQSQKANDYSKV